MENNTKKLIIVLVLAVFTTSYVTVSITAGIQSYLSNKWKNMNIFSRRNIAQPKNTPPQKIAPENMAIEILTNLTEELNAALEMFNNFRWKNANTPTDSMAMQARINTFKGDVLEIINTTKAAIATSL